MRHPKAVDVPAQIVRLHEAGETPAELAARFGISPRTVNRWLAQENTLEPGKDHQAVVDAYAAGERLASVCETFGLSDKTVLKLVREAGVATRRPHLTAQTRTLILARHRDGKTPTEIAGELNVHRSTVYRVLDGAGVPSHIRIDR